MPYAAAEDRYQHMPYRRSGRSGLQAARDHPRALAQLRRRPPARDEPGDPAARLRSGRHALRPGEQLRPAVRLGRGDVRPRFPRRLPPLPRRARHLDEGRVRHVARPVRRVGLAQVPAGVARPVARAHAARLRRHLLLAPLRSRDAARGDDGRARHARCGRARRSTRASRRIRPRRRARLLRSCARSAHRSSSTSRRTRCSTAGSSRSCSRRSPSWGSAASASRRSPRGCSPTSTSTASRRTRAPRRTPRSRPICSRTRRSRRSVG